MKMKKKLYNNHSDNQIKSTNEKKIEIRNDPKIVSVNKCQ